MLFNVGFVEAMKLRPDWQCFIFHDVDLLPEDDRNLYSCPKQPRHMSVAVDTLKYKLPYPDLFGGVSAVPTKQFEEINGFSNQFWGWGGEDDDISHRLRHAGHNITRYNADIARYTMISHAKQTLSPARRYQFRRGQRYFKTDGLNNLEYKVEDFRREKLFTLITVELIEVWPENMSDREKLKVTRLRNKVVREKKMKKKL